MEEATKEIHAWLDLLFSSSSYALEAIEGDASVRRYYRVFAQGASWVLMDAREQPQAIEPFLNVQSAMHALGVPVPEVHQRSETRPFLLLSDFGDVVLEHRLTSENAEYYYKKAWQLLFKMHTGQITQLPSVDLDFIENKRQLFCDWFLKRYLRLTLTTQEQQCIDQQFYQLSNIFLNQPQVLMHRDYHSRNLMCLQDNALGVIDFQDAMRGPCAYDLASLLKDCYVRWPRQRVEQWVKAFYDDSTLHHGVSFSTFLYWFDGCALARHLKCLGGFSRLALRDGKRRYLEAMPRLLEYVLEVCALYPEFEWLEDFFRQRVCHHFTDVMVDEEASQ